MKKSKLYNQILNLLQEPPTIKLEGIEVRQWKALIPKDARAMADEIVKLIKINKRKTIRGDKMRVFTKIFTEDHIFRANGYDNSNLLDVQLNKYLEENKDVILVSAHALFNQKPNKTSYTLDFLAIFKVREQRR